MTLGLQKLSTVLVFRSTSKVYVPGSNVRYFKKPAARIAAFSADRIRGSGAWLRCGSKYAPTKHVFPHILPAVPGKWRLNLRAGRNLYLALVANAGTIRGIKRG